MIVAIIVSKLAHFLSKHSGMCLVTQHSVIGKLLDIGLIPLSNKEISFLAKISAQQITLCCLIGIDSKTL